MTVQPFDVSCPKCGAKPGMFCKNAYGRHLNPIGRMHKERIKQAQ